MYNIVKSDDIKYNFLNYQANHLHRTDIISIYILHPKPFVIISILHIIYQRR